MELNAKNSKRTNNYITGGSMFSDFSCRAIANLVYYLTTYCYLANFHKILELKKYVILWFPWVRNLAWLSGMTLVPGLLEVAVKLSSGVVHAFIRKLIQ